MECKKKQTNSDFETYFIGAPWGFGKEEGKRGPSFFVSDHIHKKGKKNEKRKKTAFFWISPPSQMQSR